MIYAKERRATSISYVGRSTIDASLDFVNV